MDSWWFIFFILFGLSLNFKVDVKMRWYSSHTIQVFCVVLFYYTMFFVRLFALPLSIFGAVAVLLPLMTLTWMEIFSAHLIFTHQYTPVETSIPFNRCDKCYKLNENNTSLSIWYCVETRAENTHSHTVVLFFLGVGVYGSVTC